MQLSLQEALCDGGFFSHAAGRDNVDVAKLVFGVAEVLHFHQAFGDECFEAVVQPAYANAELHGQLPLGEVWVVLQDAHDPEVRVFLGFGLSAGLEACVVFWAHGLEQVFVFVGT